MLTQLPKEIEMPYSIPVMKGSVPVVVTPYGEYELKTAKLLKLKIDKRTKEGKLREKFFQLFYQLDGIAFELDEDLRDLLPK